MFGRFGPIALGLCLTAPATANPFGPAETKNDAKSAYVAKLMKGAKVTGNSKVGRRLDGDDYIPDISTYSVRYEKCQFVKTYDEEVAQEDDMGTVLATKRFVIFKLCPDNDCEACDYNYGEYLVDMEAYLEASVDYFQEQQEEMCQACEECGQNNQNNNNGNDDQNNRRLVDVDCSSCYDECQKIENMEENGYIDATEFLECQQVYDPEDDGDAGFFAGPMCASSGAKIKIGLFKDEWCSQLVEDGDVEEYLLDEDNGGNYKLSHALLKNVYDPEGCISCEEVDEDDDNNNNGDDDKEPEILDMCEQLYEEAAKCEKLHGFDNGYAEYAAYANQLAQEEIVCNYISSLKQGTYSEEGEINVDGGTSVREGGSSTTGLQKFFLCFFIIGTVGLAAYAAFMHYQLTKGAKADLSRQGGAMA